MKNEVYIHQHLGLGDHFHCNGVIRFLIKDKYKNHQVKLFAQKKFFEMVKFMYRDLDNLTVIPITIDEKNESNVVASYLDNKNNIEKIGFDYFVKNKNQKKTIDMLFYQQYNIDYSKRFELTYWKRDYVKEEKLFKALIKKEDYVFVHDDPIRGFKISDKQISNKFQIIRNSYEYSIFDYAKIIERAKEIHVMESSARCMLEYLDTKKSKHYLYNFVGGPWKSMPFYNEKNEIIGSSKKWKIIEINFNEKKNFLKRLFKL